MTEIIEYRVTDREALQKIFYSERLSAFWWADKSRVQLFLNFIYFIVFTLAALGFIGMVILDQNLTPGLVIFMIIVVGLLLTAAFRFINKTLQTEKIFVNQRILKITRTGFLSYQETEYDVRKISKFRYLGKPELSGHPLAGDSFDYLGFQTEQVMINELHGDNRVAFDYENKTISFGENIFSWQFEELQILLNNLTGIDFKNEDHA